MGPSLKYGGADFVDGKDGTWAPIGAEKTATGYQVALGKHWSVHRLEHRQQRQLRFPCQRPGRLRVRYELCP